MNTIEQILFLILRELQKLNKNFEGGEEE